MIYRQTEIFIGNEDSSSVSYRIFNDEARDLYPTFSVCFQSSPAAEIFKDKYFLGIDGVSDREFYSKYLLGSLQDEHKVQNISERIRKINFEDVFSPVRTWDSIIYNFLKQRNIIIPRPDKKEEVEDRQEIIGAYVKEPQAGLHKWIMSFDLNSLYPHLIQQYNISPETKCGICLLYTSPSPRD